MTPSNFTIVVCGAGLAGSMTALALVDSLSEAYRVVLIDSDPENQDDMFYGSVTAPTGYEFYRALGLDEPTLFSTSRTSFSYGTRYQNWPGVPADWVQCHHQPLPAFDGVGLQHYLTRQNQPLEPMLVSAVAARQGKFAHPPEDPAVPLSRAEYGYQFAPRDWAALLRSRLAGSRVEIVSEPIAGIHQTEDSIAEIKLQTGNTISGDLVVDCTGHARQVMAAIGGDFRPSRTVAARLTVQTAAQLGPPCRIVNASETGWTAQTYLQGEVHELAVTDSAAAEAGQDRIFELGRLSDAWIGNCVAIGQAACVHDPITPAPMMALQRDIERLLDLVPMQADSEAERREFNRRFEDDAESAIAFGQAFFARPGQHNSPFWREAETAEKSPRLSRKLAQFESRGVLAKYDLEPFNDEDWTILHNGLGHRPRRYDLQIESVSRQDSERRMIDLTRAVEQIVARMPPHHVYVANMKRYFEKQNYVRS